MTSLDSDYGFFALELTDARTGTSVLCERMMAMRGVFYGGAAAALACSMMEHASQRRVVLCSVQMMSSATVGDRLRLEVDQVRAGRSVSQLRVTGTVDDREVFFAFGSTGDGEPGSDALNARMPDVAAPDECPPVEWSFDPDTDHTYFGVLDLRDAGAPIGRGQDADAVARWCRIPMLPGWGTAKLAYVADTASTAIAQAIQRASGTARPGSSLDNSLRFGPQSDRDWALVVTEVDVVHHGFGHGAVRIWSEDGKLLALGNQTFTFRARRS